MNTTSKQSTPRRARAATPEAIATNVPAILFDVGASDVHVDGSPSRVWIAVAKIGRYHKAPVGDFALTAETFASIIECWARDGRKPIPVDYEHQGERPDLTGPTPACGWIHDFRIDAPHLMALTEWLPEARELIRKGAYRGISPAILLQSKDRHGRERGAVLKSAGLTNTPFLDLPAVTAKDSTAVNAPPEDHAERQQAEAASDAAVGKAFRKVSDRLATDDAHERERVAKRAAADADEERDEDEDEDEDPSTLRAEIDRLGTDLAAAKRDLARERRKRKQAEQRAADLEESIAERDEQDVAARVDDAIHVWSLRADRRALIALCKADREAFDAAHPPVPSHQRHLLLSIATGPHNVPRTAITMSDDAAAAPPPDPEKEVQAMIAHAKARGVEMSREEGFTIFMGRQQREAATR